MKRAADFGRTLLIGTFIGISMLAACNEELAPDQEETGRDSTQNGTSADFLVLSNAKKITADFPSSLDGTLRINQRDTLYLINAHPFKARVSVLHDKTIDITGHYVWVSGSTSKYYYDVPEVSAESSDSVTVIYLGMDVPENTPLPYTIEIVIQPHTIDGTPQDEFKKHVTVEDPDGSCDVYTTDDVWEWLYTEAFNYSGNIFQITAPWYSATYSTDTTDGYYFSGCCLNDVYVPYNEPTGFDGNCDEENPNYKTLWVSGGRTLTVFDYLFLYPSGNFTHYNGRLQTNFNPRKSNLCKVFAYYDRTYTEYEKTGSHNYTPGSDYFQVTIKTASPPFGPVPPRGEIVSTCHVLLITYKGEETYNFAYRRTWGIRSTDPLPDPNDYLAKWFDM